MKPRHHLYLSESVTAQLDVLAARPRASKSAIVEAALVHFIRHGDKPPGDEALRLRLDRQTREIERARRDLGIVLESVALLARYLLTVIAPASRVP